MARRKGLAVLVAGLAAVAARLAVLPILPIPHPFIADEFSYLLAADTFARGRLTNPTPPMWRHFQTLHVLMTPTFMSMYPPAQGLLLAAGKVTTGLAFAGVLAGVGLMCAAIVWMLQGWFSPGWAFLGGMIAAMRLGVFSYWANSYWGGAVAATGGALILGALPRIIRAERPRDAMWMGLGLVVLANSRPYEGLVLSVPVAFALFAWLFRKRGEELSRAMGRVIAPLTLVVLLGATCTGFYFWRVTGSPVQMPQKIHRDHSAVAPYFLWQSPRPTPAYDQPALRDFHLHNEMGVYLASRTVLGALAMETLRLVYLWMFYLGWALTPPLLLAVALLPHGSDWSRCDPKLHFLIVATAVSLAGLAVEVFYFDHYAAPMTGLILALVIAALRRVRAWAPHRRRVGRMVARATPVVCLLMLVARTGAASLGIRFARTWPPTALNAVDRVADYTRINQELDAHSGKHLVLLHYAQGGPDVGLWVYNESGDIDRERTVWAWDMGPEKNRELIRRFRNRDVWLVIPEGATEKLSRYEAAPGR